MTRPSLASQLDSYLARKTLAGRAQAALSAESLAYLDTPQGRLRLFDSGENTGHPRPCVIFTPDGPNVIEHYWPLFQLLQDDFRIVCFDMPGFGFSMPAASYQHSLDQGAQTVLDVMDGLNVPVATLAFSCANGLYAMQAARKAPQRILSLFLAQTPSLAAMHAWTGRMIPWPLRVPVLGQSLAWVLRKKLAHGWYHSALPKDTDKEPFRQIAGHAFATGGCFCLAGVVQGLVKESPDAMHAISTPCTMLWGGLDRSHRQTVPESLLDHVPHAEIIRFDDCGHFPEVEQPERYAQLLKAHVDKLSGNAVIAG
ncbi:alpha/beta fold hydrolase [Undibacterium sp.]|uniref:alpha/beta fold hydrolase n=1 Tax=Undibacterium sp. TaxID=1914977 RepID=UPI00374DEF13